MAGFFLSEENVRHHTDRATERAWERYGVVATADDWSRAVSDIMDVVAGAGRAALLLDREGGTERWIVRVAGVAVVAVYNPNSAMVITVLPAPDARLSWTYL